MRNKLRDILSLHIITITANLSSLCATQLGNKKKTYIELTFITKNSNNLLTNKINCVSLFQITLYDEVWWHVSMCNKLNQSKIEPKIRGNVTRGIVFSGKCAFGEMVHVEMKYGESVGGETIIRENVPNTNQHELFGVFSNFLGFLA
jgi:hypothetical protein